ncbi:beta-ketoacyl-[acyl-carrier-protein] synthase family protein [Acerihabitans sp. TG2]|uniref:beta-ketoacyl-[acyl-carrier-protein] synthase family protein n=1 Tax=Acerihabitans sp. TG2 TaxID=3096008 RepID=UPI002B2280D9|nr:beta-ketoacyl-[acyl-carrier-protein] synthase family protein [Acerihabitans sp. TG2]MEA9390037.1 beta-ketoacyl-[acyl-carrier-protein] synthase family protein [Acerihabitans sp. TG2]
MISISAVGMLNALGNDMAEIAVNLSRGYAPGMRINHSRLLQQRPCWLGEVTAKLPAVPAALSRHDSRNNRLLLGALAQIRDPVDRTIAAYGADRVAVVLGTSTSGLDESDQLVSACQRGQTLPGYHYHMQELGDPARFLSAYLALNGPSYTLSTACSSSARAIISGRRLIETGMADVAIVGGADSLSRMPINGFDSLESLSANRCRPFSAERDGISIGEGAALLLLTREPHDIALRGIGESSDAWHMSAPHPEGSGAIRAIQMALMDARLNAADIGYINLHGTATELNDHIEAKVIHQLFGNRVPCSSTKHLTGHTLGAAGAIEAALAWLCLTQDIPLPPQDFTDATLDGGLADCGLLTAPGRLERRFIMSNSFAFGGNNTCLILGDH